MGLLVSQNPTLIVNMDSMYTVDILRAEGRRVIIRTLRRVSFSYGG